jgi:hypothetical protein
MRRLVACIVLVCLGLSATLPGVCAAAGPEDNAGAHALHGAHHASHAGSHTAESPAAPAPGTGQHHDDCALMVRCHWTAIAPPSESAAIVACDAGHATPAQYLTPAAPVTVIDTPPPRTIS